MPLWHDRVDDHEQQQRAAHTARRNKRGRALPAGATTSSRRPEIATHSATNRSEWREAKRKGPEGGVQRCTERIVKGSHMVRSYFHQPRCHG